MSRPCSRGSQIHLQMRTVKEIGLSILDIGKLKNRLLKSKRFKPGHIRHSTLVSKVISGKEFLTKFNYYHVISTCLHSWGLHGNKVFFYKIMALYHINSHLFVPSSPACESYYIGGGGEKYQSFCFRAVANISECFLSWFVARSH